MRGALPLRAGYVYAAVPQTPPKMNPGGGVQIAYRQQRKLSQLLWLVVHHTGDDPTTRPTAEETAAYQISGGAQLPFPGLAYTGFIEADGSIKLAWDLETATWSQGDGSPSSIDGVGVYNYQGIAFCFSGRDPTPAQAAAYQRVHSALVKILGHHLDVKGHREVSGLGDTVCPGDAGMALVEKLGNNILDAAASL